MKVTTLRVLSILLLLLALLSAAQKCHAQPPQKINADYQFKSAGSDSSQRLPKARASLVWLDSGAVAYNKPDSSVYVWTGTQWIKIGGGATVPASPVTSVQYNNSGAFGGSASMEWNNTNKVFSADSVTSYLLQIKNLTGANFKIIFHTKQGDSLPSRFGQYTETIDQSFRNDDGIIDAAKSWGYNWSGQGKVVSGDVAYGTTFENHYIPFPGGRPQSEYYQSFFSHNGNQDRVISWNLDDTTGASSSKFALDQIAFYGSTNSGLGSIPYFTIGNGGLIDAIGDNAALRATTRVPATDGAFDITTVPGNNGRVDFLNNSGGSDNIFQFNSGSAIFIANQLAHGFSNYWYSSNSANAATHGLIFVNNNFNPNIPTFTAWNNGGVSVTNSLVVGADNAAPSSSSAIIEFISTTKGVILPKMTTVQKLAISSPIEGLFVYDITLHQMSYYNGTTWTNL